jgi:peptidoglycan endopeptidase LytE
VVQRLKVQLILFQKDFFEDTRRVINNIDLVINNKKNYISLESVLEILEYDYFRKTPQQFVVTDGSEFVTIPRTGSIARREGVSFRIDPLFKDRGNLFLSLRSINRLFNVDVSFFLSQKRVRINQPGKFFITFRGDTLKSIARLLNTTIKKVLSLNKNLKEPIPSNVRVIIPTESFEVKSKMNPVSARRVKRVKIKQAPDVAPAIISLGRRLIGKPYQFGAGPFPRSRKFDCSSYIQYIFRRNGVNLPRTTRSQARVGKTIPLRDVEPGDLIFFRRDRYSDNRIGHVGIDIGGGRMLNTYSSPPGVTVTSWRAPFWRKRYVTTKEIL